MMSEVTVVIVGTVLAFGLGMVWFSPKLFGAKCTEGNGLNPGKPEKPPVADLMAQLAGTFLLAWVVGVTAKNETLFTIVLITLTMIVLNGASVFFTDKNAYMRHTDAGYTVAMVVIMIICQGIL